MTDSIQATSWQSQYEASQIALKHAQTANAGLRKQVAEAKAENKTLTIGLNVSRQSHSDTQIILNGYIEVLRDKLAAKDKTIAGLEGVLNKLAGMVHCSCHRHGKEYCIHHIATAAFADAGSTCEWKYDEDHGKYDTGCGGVWTFEYDDVKENGVKFCMFCGKPVTETKQ